MYIRGHDCYFIHINKTGGMSVVRALDTKSDHPYPGRALEHSQEPRWRKAFKFSFVRNPWDKECSDYHYHSSLAHKETQQKALSFEEYLQIPEMHPHHVDHYWHSNQVDWLRSVNGEIEMDFIGRFENLAQTRPEPSFGTSTGRTPSTSATDSETSAMPVPNIGSTQRRLRLLGGVAASAVALAALGLLLSQGAPRWWRAILFLPFLAANIGLLQHREKT